MDANELTNRNWLTTSEAAEFSGYNVWYVRQLLRDGSVESKKFGRTWMVSVRSLAAYLLKCRDTGDFRYGPHKWRGR